MSSGGGSKAFSNTTCSRDATGLDVLLMRNSEYYVTDGNKNIIALKDSSGADVSTYAYTPFGALENPEDGDENPFRFSSEYYHGETKLIYYNYRYYSPELSKVDQPRSHRRRRGSEFVWLHNEYRYFGI